MPRLLFVTLESPWPPNRGGRQRSNLLHRALRQCGEVDVVLISDNEYSADELEVMRTEFGLLGQLRPTARGLRGPWRWLRPVAPRQVDRLAHNMGRRSVAYAADPAVSTWISNQVDLSKYDLLVARYVFALTRSGLAGRLRTILDVDDLITSVYRYRLQVGDQNVWQRLMLRRHLRQHERQLPNVFRQCQRVWVANSDDITECRGPNATTPNYARVLPNIPWQESGFHQESQPPVTATAHVAQPAIITVGSLNYGANLHGVTQFVQHVWPRVRAAVPNAEFLIIGNGMTDAMKHEWAKVPGVRPIGFVDDVGTWYERAAFAVAPVFFGGGTNIKVLEAFHYHRTCVLTAQAHRGYGMHLKHRESLFVGHTFEQLADGCIQLLHSPDTAREWAETGSRIVAREYSWNRFAEVVTTTVNEVLTL